MADKNSMEAELLEHASSFVERLQKASDELDSIKNSFSKGMDDLAKIQSLLSLEGIDKLSGMVQDFEDRLLESERLREEALAEAKKYSEELEKEKERLVKLWDAYKNQEETLSKQEKRTLELEEKLRETEQSMKKLEEDSASRLETLTRKLEEKEKEMSQLEDFRQRIIEFDNIRNQLEESVHSLKQDLKTKDETIKALENQVEELKEFKQYEEFKTKYEDIAVEYEKEKERLTKLYNLYEELEDENKRLKAEVKGWQEWFDSNEEIFTKLFSSADHLRRKTSALKEKRLSPQESTEMVEEKVSTTVSREETVSPTDEEIKKKSRRKLRFKK
jgi:chromosome segregation ATPase